MFPVLFLWSISSEELFINIFFSYSVSVRVSFLSSQVCLTFLNFSSAISAAAADDDDVSVSRVLYHPVSFPFSLVHCMIIKKNT